jgi:hypothetical protein
LNAGIDDWRQSWSSTFDNLSIRGEPRPVESNRAPIPGPRKSIEHVGRRATRASARGLETQH